MVEEEKEEERNRVMKRRKRSEPFYFHSQCRQKRQQLPLFSHKKENRWAQRYRE